MAVKLSRRNFPGQRLASQGASSMPKPRLIPNPATLVYYNIIILLSRPAHPRRTDFFAAPATVLSRVAQVTTMERKQSRGARESALFPHQGSQVQSARSRAHREFARHEPASFPPTGLSGVRGNFHLCAAWGDQTAIGKDGFARGIDLGWAVSGRSPERRKAPGGVLVRGAVDKGRNEQCEKG